MKLITQLFAIIVGVIYLIIGIDIGTNEALVIANVWFAAAVVMVFMGVK